MDDGVADFQADRNLVIGVGAGLAKIDFQKMDRETHGLNGLDPQFMNSSLFDFHLKRGSPCAGTGLDLSLQFNTDITGETRSGRWTIGPYQFPVPPPAPTGLRVRQ